MKNLRYIDGMIFVFILSLISCSGIRNSASGFNLENELLKHNYEKIKLNKLASGHLTLKTVLNGTEGNFILDTGAGATILEEKRKEKFGLKTKNISETAVGAGGQDISMQASENNTLAIGRLKLGDFTIYLISLDHVNQALLAMGLKEIDGIIGANILSYKKGIIDYEKLALYLKIE